MSQTLSLILSSTKETLIMVFFSTVFSVIIGLPVGVLLSVSRKERDGGIASNVFIYTVLGKIVNILRSFPFIILMIVLIPLSRFILGTGIGTASAIIPLSIAASPFVARITETSLSEIDSGVIQAAISTGSTKWQIITKVIIPEALPSLIRGLTLTIINLISYSAMAGALGGGGLGDLAIRYGYQRFRTDIMLISIIVIILLVEIIQAVGNLIADRISAKR